MSSACRPGSCVLRGSCTRPRLTAPPSRLRVRLLATDSKKQPQDVIPQIPNDTIVAITRHQWHLEKPLDTLRQIFIHSALPSSIQTVAKHIPKPPTLRTPDAASVNHDHAGDKTASRSPAEQYRDLIIAQLQACLNPAHIVRVITAALGPSNQNSQEKAFRNAILQQPLVQDTLLRRLETLRENRHGQFLQEKTRIKRKESVNQLEPRRTLNRPWISYTSQSALSCLNSIVYRFEQAEITISSSVLRHAVLLAASTLSISSFRRYFSKLWRRLDSVDGYLPKADAVYILQRLRHGVNLEHTAQLGVDKAELICELLDSDGLGSPGSTTLGMPSLRRCFQLSDPDILEHWLAIFATARNADVVKAEWHRVENSVSDSDQAQERVIAVFITSLFKAGDASAGWNIFKQYGKMIRQPNEPVWRQLLLNSEAKPELKDKGLESMLEQQWAGILEKEVKRLEDKLGLKWVPDSSKESSRASDCSLGGYHQYEQEDLMSLWTKRFGGENDNADETDSEQGTSRPRRSR